MLFIYNVNTKSFNPLIIINSSSSSGKQEQLSSAAMLHWVCDRVCVCVWQCGDCVCLWWEGANMYSFVVVKKILISNIIIIMINYC